MGMTLFLDSKPESEFDQDWTKSDGKNLIDVLWQALDLIQKHLKIDLSPLKKLGSEELTLKDAAEISEETGVSPEQMKSVLSRGPKTLVDCGQAMRTPNGAGSRVVRFCRASH